jgi:hypothetical protein
MVPVSFCPKSEPVYAVLEEKTTIGTTFIAIPFNSRE